MSSLKYYGTVTYHIDIIVKVVPFSNAPSIIRALKDDPRQRYCLEPVKIKKIISAAKTF